MRRCVVILVCLLLTMALAVRAENRFLFVLESSASMASRSNAIEKSIVGLLKTGIHGELRPHDTIGLWVYNDELHTDFPMQVWTPKSSEAIVSAVASYVRKLHYEKRGHLEKVLPVIGQVMAESERLTVIIIDDGTQEIKGTPFDDDINNLEKHYVREFRKAHQPIVIVLAASAGQVYDYTVNKPDSISVPHTAEPWPTPATNAPVAAAPAPAPAMPVPAPPATPAPPVKHIQIIMSGRTNLSNSPELAEGAAPAAPVTKPMPAPAPTAPATAPVAVVVTVPPVITNSAPVMAQTQPRPPSSSEPTRSETTANAPPPVSPETNVALTNEALAKIPAPGQNPPPAVPASKPPVMAPAPNPLPAPIPPPSSAQQLELFVIAISLLTIAIVLVIFLIRRSRNEHRPSLISQSMDRPL